MKIFVAAATGALGLPLVRALCTLFHEVTGRGASVDGAVGECLMGRPGGSPHAAEFDPAKPQWLRWELPRACAAREVFFPGFLPGLPRKSRAPPLTAHRNDDQRPATDEGE